MLEIRGQGYRLCDRITRRTMLRVGALAPIGLSLPALLAARAQAGTAQAGPTGGSFGRAKRCLLLFMWGGPSHIDTFDMKPDAPVEVRGEFRPISTSVPGTQVCEHLPTFARMMDQIALIRSVTHTDNNHSTSAHWMLTGKKHERSAENFAAKGDDAPHIGSVISKMMPGHGDLPTFVSLPEQIGTTIGAVTPGQNGGILGKQFDPFLINRHPDEPDFKVENLALPADVDQARMHGRQDLLAKFNAARKKLLLDAEVAALDAYQQEAIDLVTSPKAHKAFDLQAEGDAMRDRFGRHTFGQGLLLARRLLEAGVKLVTVYWHRERPGGTENSWDTHSGNFVSLKNRLLPQVDKPLTVLLEDLGQRGLLDDTLVVWSSEFGRTPKVNNNNGGRDHWGPCNSVWLAGAGVPGGAVYGESDRIASRPLSDPVSPDDLSATIFHMMGLKPDLHYYDPLMRPIALSLGQPLRNLIG